MSIELDKIDRKILYHLDYNARIQLIDLARKCGISKQNLNYRLKKLMSDKTIIQFSSVIDFHKLGYVAYRIYARYRSVTEKEDDMIINYFKRHSSVIWFVSLSGEYDVEIVFAAKNPIQFNNLFKKLKEDIGQYFSRYNISTSISNYHLKREYLLEKDRGQLAPSYYGLEPTNQAIDSVDIKLLIELSKDCRQTTLDIGKKIGVTYHTVKNRMGNLERSKIIQSHRILIDLKKIHRIYYKALISLNNPTKEEEKKLYAFLSQFSSIVYLVEILGDWQLEIEAEVKSQEEFNDIIKKMRNMFPELIADYNIVQVLKEHKLNYFPMGEDLLKNT